MAKSDSFFKPSGTIDGISFYKLGEITVMRRAWGPDKKRIQKDPHYEGLRSYHAEFRSSVKAGRQFRTALYVFLGKANCKGLSPRVNQLMLALRKLDETSERGKREPAKGLKTPEGKAMLRAFAFTPSAPLTAVLFSAPECDAEQSTLRFRELLARRDLKFPKGATHVRLSAALAQLDLSDKLPTVTLSQEFLFGKHAEVQDLLFEFINPPKKESFQIFVLRVDFFQDVKGDLVLMTGDGKICCGVVGVEYIV